MPNPQLVSPFCRLLPRSMSVPVTWQFDVTFDTIELRIDSMPLTAIVAWFGPKPLISLPANVEF